MPGLNRPSLLDRLLDDHYESPVSSEDWTMSVADLERSVVRDLNDLVNTARADPAVLPADCTELLDSLLFYGMTRPGLLGKSKEDRQQVKKELELAIRRFEPRLVRVRVEETPLTDGQTLDASLVPYSFRILADLRVDPLPESVLLDATLSRYPQTIRITPGQSAVPVGSEPAAEKEPSRG